MSNPFVKATKTRGRLRLALAGPSGSGKTFSGLAIGSRLAELCSKPLAVIDTEHGTASKYADRFTFDTVDLEPPYHPDRYIDLLKAAAEAGYGVVQIDSLSHAWFGTGGLLEEVDKVAARMKSSNSFAAWKEVTPIQNRLIESLLASPCHLIVCMRSKTEYVLEKDERTGKTAPRKVGMAPIQRDGLEYEFDVMGELDLEHRLIVDKSRCPEVDGAVIEKPGADLAETLYGWLSDGAEPVSREARQREEILARWREGCAEAEKTVKEIPAIGIGQQAEKFLGRVAASGWDRDSIRDVLEGLGIAEVEDIPYSEGFATALEQLLRDCPRQVVMEEEPGDEYSAPEPGALFDGDDGTDKEADHAAA